MSTWTSKPARRLCRALALALAVAGPAVAEDSAPRAVSVSQGGLVVTGPSGYCVDMHASRDGTAGAFVLFGTCAALSGKSGFGRPSRPGVLTASVIDGAPAEGIASLLPEMAAFFATPAGKRALSRSGNPETVELRGSYIEGTTLYLDIVDRAASAQRVAPGYWRAVLALNGRTVSLSVMSLADDPLGESEKRRLLQSFVARMKSANGAGLF
ncbi:MAG: hypothetical protein H6895_04070 [Defluviimonas sp.]|uniref:hypothetical protein n=1 Tax=Albidovulum sp. TaxID=1872424 RepID=UPI001DF571F2|nr:hypothetical protein [Paracoccaceae bacterium]MCC0063249.1 hypothetical protein [Defluviimonas sp.]